MPAKLPRAAAMGSGSSPNRRAPSPAASRFRRLCSPGTASLAGRRVSVRPCLPAQSHAVLQIRSRALRPQRGAGEPVHLGRGALGEIALPGVVGVEHRELLRLLGGEEHPFIRDVAGHVRVLVLVVRQDAGDQADPGGQQAPPPQVAQLPGGELQHHRVLRPEILQETQRRNGDVAPQPAARVPGLQAAGQSRGGGGLAFAARHGQDRTRAQPEEDRQVRLHGNAPLAGQSQERGGEGHRRIFHHQIGLGEVALFVAPQHGAHPVRGQLGQQGLEGGGILAVVGDRDPGAVPGEKQSRGQAASVQAQAHHRHAPAGELMRPDLQFCTP